MQRNRWMHVFGFVVTVTAATAILVAAGLGERTGIEHAAPSGAAAIERR